MAFVIDRFWLPLLLAAVIGFMIGWATCGRSEKSWTSSWLPLGILAAIVGAFVAAQTILPGRFGLWLETGLLMFATYLAGCCLACMMRRLMFGREVLPAIDPDAALATAGVAVVPAVVETATAPRSPESDDSKLAAMVAASGAGIMATASDIAARPPKMAAATNASGRDAVGIKPPLLHRPRDGRKDDLTMIWGVAEKLEERMNRMGIWHFDQIAAWTPDHVKWFEHEIEGFTGRLERDKWIEQCEKLAKGWRPENKIGARPKG